MKWYRATEIDTIPVKEGRRVKCGKTEIALFNLGEEFLAVGNRCPHKAGPLADGIVCGKTVTCPLHNLNISLETGYALHGEKGKVKVYPTKVSDGKVYIAIDEGKFSSSSQPSAISSEQLKAES